MRVMKLIRNTLLGGALFLGTYTTGLFVLASNAAESEFNGEKSGNVSEYLKGRSSLYSIFHVLMLERSLDRRLDLWPSTDDLIGYFEKDLELDNFYNYYDSRADRMIKMLSNHENDRVAEYFVEVFYEKKFNEGRRNLMANAMVSPYIFEKKPVQRQIEQRPDLLGKLTSVLDSMKIKDYDQEAKSIITVLSQAEYAPSAPVLLGIASQYGSKDINNNFGKHVVFALKNFPSRSSVKAMVRAAKTSGDWETTYRFTEAALETADKVSSGARENACSELGSTLENIWIAYPTRRDYALELTKKYNCANRLHDSYWRWRSIH